jgi:hypothetical protein
LPRGAAVDAWAATAPPPNELMSEFRLQALIRRLSDFKTRASLPISCCSCCGLQLDDKMLASEKLQNEVPNMMHKKIEHSKQLTI